MDELFGDINFNGNAGNFDPDEVDSDEVINAVFVIDVSPSISNYVSNMNQAFKEFKEEMEGSHVGDNLLVSLVEFNDRVEVKTGFQPIKNVPLADIKPSGMGTALFDGVEDGLKIAIDYREKLEASGVSCKTILFVITDGEDNSSKRNAAANVKELHNQILRNERNAFGFASILFGVGHDGSFEDAKEQMGIQHLAKIGNSGADIRKMINFISSSISSTSNNANIPDINF